jgi:hypothetical protein
MPGDVVRHLFCHSPQHCTFVLHVDYDGDVHVLDFEGHYAGDVIVVFSDEITSYLTRL